MTTCLISQVLKKINAKLICRKIKIKLRRVRHVGIDLQVFVYTLKYENIGKLRTFLKHLKLNFKLNFNLLF